MPKSKQNAPLVESVESLSKSKKILTKEEEVFLVKQKHNNPKARDKLITSHIRFVNHIARDYKGYGFPHSDIVQEGIVGLMKAVNKFDLSYNVRFATYAVRWIKAEINEFVMRNFRIVKVATTKAQRKLFFNLRKMRSGKSHSMTHEEAVFIAEELDVPLFEVIEMEKRMIFNFTSLDAQLVDNDLDGDIAHFHNLLPDEIDVENDFIKNFDNKKSISIVQEAISGLNENQKIIVSERVMPEKEDKAKLTDLSSLLGVSPERVRQIEAQSLKLLKQNLSENLCASH
tara:strand:+ start:1194 stop:2051 length:858 start_codon:yes stop_codon:yes gene_type:complete